MSESVILLPAVGEREAARGGTHDVTPILHERGVYVMQTLDQHIFRYLAERRARGEIGSSTVSDIRSRLASLSSSFGARPLNRLTEPAVEQWLATIGSLRASTRRAYLSTVRQFCRWMVRRGHLKADPTVELQRIREPRSVPRALPADKIARLLGAQPEPRDQAMLWLMIGIGLRCCEVAWLTVEDYDPLVPSLLVRGKAGNERLLPVPDIVAGALNVYLEGTGWRSGPLVRSHNDPSRGLHRSTISQMVGGWMIGAGVKGRRGDGISAHALRHTCASDVLDKCGDVRIVQYLLGHANLSTTSRYLRRASQQQLRAALEGRTYRAA